MPKKKARKPSPAVVNKSERTKAQTVSPVDQKFSLSRLLLGLLLIVPSLYILSYLAILLISNVTLAPIAQRFEKYAPLENWDLRRHVMNEDIDGDTKSDMVSFTGCLFLSSLTTEAIPAEKQCTADGIGSMGGFPNESVGQKYTSDPDTDLSLSNDRAVIEYSYMGKVPNGEWSLYSKEYNQPLKHYQFNDQWLLEEKPVPWQANLDYVLYKTGSLVFTIVTLPLWLTSWFFSLFA